MALRKNISGGLVNSVALWGNDMWGSAELRGSMILELDTETSALFLGEGEGEAKCYIAVAGILSGTQRLTVHWLRL